MMEQRARRARGVIWATGLLVLIWANFQILPMVVVYAPSASLRKGWYVRDFAARGVTIGDLVVVDMPGWMWTTVEVDGLPQRLLKHVAAGAGDRVCWGTDAMTVYTGVGTVIYPYYPAAMVLQQHDGCHIVAAGELLLVGTHPRSFDSRYIGVVDGGLLRFRVHPLWTWEAA